MSATAPTVLALDFDGVVCNGLKEYFQTAWRAYCHLWQTADSKPPEGTAEQFYLLRPVVETGWEMPLLIRAILLGMETSDVLLNWATLVPELARQEGVESTQLAAEVDGVRDRWIATDVEGWLAEHQFYPGIIDRLQNTLASAVQTVIISTKEKRFIEQLLQQQGIDLTNLEIFGKEVKRPKHQVLREVMAEVGDAAQIWFVEDRLKTLQGIDKQPDLAAVQLFLADWGYNTQVERGLAATDPRITLISLEQFRQDFSNWVAVDRRTDKS